MRNSWKEFDSQTHCGFKYYRQSLGEIFTEFTENHPKLNANECASPEPRQNKMKAFLHQFCKPQMWYICSTLPHFETFPSSLCVTITRIMKQNMIFSFSSPSSTALSQFEDICSLQKCTMQHLFRGFGSNITWTLDAPSFRWTLGCSRPRVSFH